MSRVGFQKNNKLCLIHGHNRKGKRSPTYHTWNGMIQRCTNPKHQSYHYYGGRGIRVCKTWLKFENFLVDMGERTEGMSLDRIDFDGDYCIENCRWVTWDVQVANRRSGGLKKLLKREVIAIRELVKRNCPVTQKRLAEWFGVNRVTINDIVNNRTWRVI